MRRIYNATPEQWQLDLACQECEILTHSAERLLETIENELEEGNLTIEEAQLLLHDLNSKLTHR